MFSKTSIVLLSLCWFAAVTSSPAFSFKIPEFLQIHTKGHPEKSAIIENIIRNALEDLREMMLTGSGSIPVLDPLQIQRVDIDENQLDKGNHITLENILVNKLSTFEVASLEVITVNTLLQRYQVKCLFSIPQLDVRVENYDLRLHALGFNLFGNGGADIKLIEPKLDLDLLLNFRIGLGSLHLNIMECKIVPKLLDIQINITGMFNMPSADDFVSSFLKHLIMDAINTFPNEISNLISPVIMNVANEALKDINLINLIM